MQSQKSLSPAVQSYLPYYELLWYRFHTWIITSKTRFFASKIAPIASSVRFNIQSIWSLENRNLVISNYISTGKGDRKILDASWRRAKHFGRILKGEGAKIFVRVTKGRGAKLLDLTNLFNSPTFNVFLCFYGFWGLFEFKVTGRGAKLLDMSLSEGEKFQKRFRRGEEFWIFNFMES